MSALKDAIHATNAALVDIQRDRIYELDLENQKLKNEIVRLKAELDKQELVMWFMSNDKKDLIPAQTILDKA